MRKISWSLLMLMSLMYMVGCGTETKINVEEFDAVQAENDDLQKQLENLETELSKQQSLSAEKDETIKKLQEELKMSEQKISESADEEQQVPVDSEIPLPGNPELPSPMAATHEPTKEQRQQMSDLDPFEALITSDENLPVYDSFLDQDNAITELTPGYSVKVHATSDDGMWYYITTTTYDGDPISGFVFAVFVRELSSFN